VSVAAAVCIGTFCYLLVGALIGRLPRPHRWRRERAEVGSQRLWLAQAGLALSPLQFWSLSVLMGALAAGALYAVTGSLLVALVPGVAAASIPRAYYGSRRAARLRELQESWPDGLRDLVASIASGRSLNGALGELARTGPEPIRRALVRFAGHARMLGTIAALQIVREEVADPTSDRVIEVLILASERGGQVVKEILEDLVVATTKDLKVLDEIATEGLEMRINARAVLVLPWFVLVALTLRGGAFRDFYASSAGLLVVLVGATLSALGYLWISHLGRAQQEPRVLGSARTSGAGSRT
jgi:tight adherence protein B